MLTQGPLGPVLRDIRYTVCISCYAKVNDLCILYVYTYVCIAGSQPLLRVAHNDGSFAMQPVSLYDKSIRL